MSKTFGSDTKTTKGGKSPDRERSGWYDKAGFCAQVRKILAQVFQDSCSSVVGFLAQVRKISCSSAQDFAPHCGTGDFKS